MYEYIPIYQLGKSDPRLPDSPRIVSATFKAIKSNQGVELKGHDDIQPLINKIIHIQDAAFFVLPLLYIKIICMQTI